MYIIIIIWSVGEQTRVMSGAAAGAGATQWNRARVYTKIKPLGPDETRIRAFGHTAVCFMLNTAALLNTAAPHARN